MEYHIHTVAEIVRGANLCNHRGRDREVKIAKVLRSQNCEVTERPWQLERKPVGQWLGGDPCFEALDPWFFAPRT